MNRNLAAALAAAITVASVVSYEVVKDQTPKTDAQVKATGVDTAYNVYPVRDDKGSATIYVAKLPDGGFQKLDASPCARKPSKSADCSRLNPDGKLSDPGVDNTMQAGGWQGPECVRTACVIMAGEEPETGP